MRIFPITDRVVHGGKVYNLNSRGLRPVQKRNRLATSSPRIGKYRAMQGAHANVAQLAQAAAGMTEVRRDDVRNAGGTATRAIGAARH